MQKSPAFRRLNRLFRSRRWRLALAAMTVGLLAVNAIAYSQARALTHFTTSGDRTCKPEDLRGLALVRVLLFGAHIPKPQNIGTPAQVGLAYETIAVAEEDGTKLSGWLCPADGSSRLAILFHGYASEKSSLLHEARAFHDLGLNVMLIDFRGSGNSTGDRTTIGYREADDVAAVFRYARSRFPDQSILLYGESMGAAAILRAVDKGGVKPDSIVLDSVFDRLLQTARNRFTALHVPSFPGAQLLVFWAGIDAGVESFAHNPVTYARRVACPILFLHGEDDPRATLAEGRRVFDAVPGAAKTFVSFAGSGHGSQYLGHEEKWTAAIKRLLAM